MRNLALSTAVAPALWGTTYLVTTELLHKDIKMCIDEAEKLGAPLMVSPAARQFLARHLSHPPP